jgi:pyruvate dehydrogenase E1 component alpha subunit
MGTSAERSSSNTEYFTRGDKIPGIQVRLYKLLYFFHHLIRIVQVNGMDIIAARQGVQYARKWVTEGNGPLVMEFATYRYGGHSYVIYT